MASLNLVNIFARDIVGLSKFYQQVFDFTEVRKYRSPIFRCLRAGGAELGSNAAPAYQLLALEKYKKTSGVKIFINVEARSKREVDERVKKALKKARKLSKNLT
jgi:hypothetical protein